MTWREGRSMCHNLDWAMSWMVEAVCGHVVTYQKNYTIGKAWKNVHMYVCDWQLILELLFWSLKRFCPGSDSLPLCWHHPDISWGRSPPRLPCLTRLQVESPPGGLPSPLIWNLDKLLVQREVVADGILKIMDICNLIQTKYYGKNTICISYSYS